MHTPDDKETRYFIEIDLDSLEIIRVGHEHKALLEKGRQTRANTHRLFLARGQYNKFVSRCKNDLQHVLDS